MSAMKSRVSRRRFIGSSISAAVGGLAATSIPHAAKAERRISSDPLEGLLPQQDPDEAFWWEIRSQFNIQDGLTFMNTGTFGPPPRVVREEHLKIQRELSEDPRDNYRTGELRENKAVLADFFGAAPEEIAYMRSTTEGLAEGDEVLMCNYEHPGGYGAYRALEHYVGIKVNEVDIPILPESVDQVVELYERAITPRTRAIVVSHITYISGLLTPAATTMRLQDRNGCSPARVRAWRTSAGTSRT